MAREALGCVLPYFSCCSVPTSVTFISAPHIAARPLLPQIFRQSPNFNFDEFEETDASSPGPSQPMSAEGRSLREFSAGRGPLR